MAKKMSPGQAKAFLGNVAPDCSFWVNNGAILKNMGELSSALSRMNQAKFAHHVGKGKNDFAKWVREVIKDKSLAKNMLKAKTKPTLAKAVSARIKQLKKMA